ncbi:hypothetical protein [Pseudoprimorskyibacter insulae]|uniref:HTH psq-type domain-containing protein n=1 Tax=Pseudoprimorskyibacter insulae TaxID=1695997 RepID=A0A2R8AZA5_9RHOB|nr:hypothetical protein [Pseudoprimorskyibacter insulae]SPF81179.1 hypothetical protein PRI8871_03001 [Pseudoprimorskyibacter insulae]
MANRRPSHALTFNDAIEICELYLAGEFQNRIAAKFDVNPGRVSEVIKGRKFIGAMQQAIAKKQS